MAENRVQPAKGGDGVDRLIFICPGCDDRHQVTVGERGKWGWNGSLDKPTFEGSVLVTGGSDNITCHSFVRDGQIQYLTDSTHKLSGQTVDVPVWRVPHG